MKESLHKPHTGFFPLLTLLYHFPWLKLCIAIGSLGIPLFTTLLFFSFPHTLPNILFLLFILAYSFLRVWETFYTSKERKKETLHGDWPLVLVTLSYQAMCFLMIAEFFTRPGGIHPLPSSAGLALFLGGYFLRYSGMKALGSQWSIHAVGAVKIKRVRLIRLGAYRYIRHPVYLGVMLEELGMPLMFSAIYASLFALALCWPLVFVRAREEEKSSLRKLGEAYLRYKSEVSMFLPVKYLSERLLR